MVIDKNEKEKYALELFEKKERQKALQVQDEFIVDLHRAIEEGFDHCTCNGDNLRLPRKVYGVCRDAPGPRRSPPLVFP